MTTVASGRCTSLPMPLLNAIQRRRHDNTKPPCRRFELLESAAVFQPITGWQLHLACDCALHVLHERTEVAATHVGRDHNPSLAILAIDLIQACRQLEFCQFAKRHVAPICQRHRQRLELVRVRARCFGQPNETKRMSGSAGWECPAHVAIRTTVSSATSSMDG